MQHQNIEFTVSFNLYPTKITKEPARRNAYCRPATHAALQHWMQPRGDADHPEVTQAIADAVELHQHLVR